MKAVQPTWPDLRWMLLVLVVAATVRVGWVTCRYARGPDAAALTYPDEQAYALVARSLAEGQGLRDEFGYRATYMPGYPAFLAVFTGAASPWLWARLVQALLAAWVAPATMLLAWRFTALTSLADAAPTGRRPAVVVAGLAAALDPFLLFFSGLLLTEALYAAILVTAWAVVLPMIQTGRRVSTIHSLAAGVWIGLGLLLRPSSAFLAVATPLAVLIARRFDRHAWRSQAILAAVVLLMLLPWAARNRAVLGQWRGLTTRGGISLYDGLRAGADGASDLAHTKTMPAVQDMNELEWDRYFRTQAFNAARRDPGRVLRLAGLKFLRTWSLTPHVENYRSGTVAWISALWTALILIAAAVGAWVIRRDGRAWIMLLLPVVVLTAVHMVFVGSLRYRVPVMPMLMVLAAMGVVVAGRAIRRRAAAARVGVNS